MNELITLVKTRLVWQEYKNSGTLSDWYICTFMFHTLINPPQLFLTLAPDEDRTESSITHIRKFQIGDTLR